MKMPKVLFVLLIVAFGVLSCGKSLVPDSTIHKTEVVQTGFKPGPTPQDPVQPVYDTLVTIAPTWGQANQFASERGDYATWQVLGWVALLVFAGAIYGRTTEASWFPQMDDKFLGVALALLLAASLSCFKWQASSIRWNNDKVVSKVVYDKAMKEAGSTKPIWDSLRANCKIVYGPYECFDKKK